MHVWLQELPVIDRGKALFADGPPEVTLVLSDGIAINMEAVGSSTPSSKRVGIIGGYIAAGIVLMLLIVATGCVIVRGTAKLRRGIALREKNAVRFISHQQFMILPPILLAQLLELSNWFVCTDAMVSHLQVILVARLHLPVLVLLLLLHAATSPG